MHGTLLTLIPEHVDVSSRYISELSLPEFQSMLLFQVGTCTVLSFTVIPEYIGV